MTAEVQRLVADRYRLLSLIAIGGMGEVWRADDERLGRTVAIKLLKPEYGAEPAFLARFRAEARHAAGLSHSGIAAVFDYGEVSEDGRTVAYLVMELVDGEPLSQLLARRGPLPPGLALRIVGLTGLALQAAHDAGVIHRDVKPGNLIVSGADGPVDDVTVKVTDFGIARAVDSAPLTRTGMVMGTAHYLSPEQARAGTVTPASDVYALGVVAYECLAGRRPFTGDTAFAIAAAHAHQPPPPLPVDVPPDVRALVEYAMAKAPEARPPSAGAFGRSALALAETHRLTGASDSAVLADAPTQPVTAAVPAVAPVPGVSETRVLPAVPAGPPPTRTRPPVSGPPPRARRNLWPWVVALLVLAIIGAAGWALSSDLGGSGTPSPTTSSHPATRTTPAHPTTSAHTTSAHPTTTRATTTKPTTPASVTVTAADYVGRPYNDVAADLQRLGLHPTPRSVPSGGPAGSVTGVSPTGAVPRGGTVTVDVVATPSASAPGSASAPAGKPSKAGKPKPPSGGPGKKKGKGGTGGHGG